MGQVLGRMDEGRGILVGPITNAEGCSKAYDCSVYYNELNQLSRLPNQLDCARSLETCEIHPCGQASAPAVTKSDLDYGGLYRVPPDLFIP